MGISLSEKLGVCGDNLMVKIIGKVDLNPILLTKEMGSFSKKKKKTERWGYDIELQSFWQRQKLVESQVKHEGDTN